MSWAYPIPAGRHRVELVVQRSRFVATADHAPTVAAAKALLEVVRRELPDATHHVHAFAVGHGASVIHGSGDDGEPPGTAGRPTLAVVAGSGLGDVCVVTARYFGGIKLGTGGLVKAYTEAAQHVLAEVPRGVHEVRRVVRLTVPYGLYASVSRVIEAHGGRLRGTDFAVDVGLTADFPVDRVAGFAAAVAELSSGRVAVDLADA
ncbi:YigZ family protein [bacterium]|nr:DUF1949 domain-containing protein [Chloroflexi bacterium CFX6]RIL12006.1 MAG: YigZ family protein [bacterium]